MISRAATFSTRHRRLILSGLLGLELLYLLAVNLFLQPWAGPQWMRSRPDKFLIEWRAAWSVVPGLIHVRGLQLRGRTPALSWELELETLRTWIVVPSLLWRRFSVVGARGSGLDFRLARDPTRGDLGGQPTIEGFAPALEKPKKPRRRPLTIAIDDFQIDGIQEIWLYRQRYTGKGHLAGSAQIEVGTREVADGDAEVSVPQLELVLEAGTLSLDGSEAGELEHLEANLVIEPYQPKQHRGLAGLRFVSGTLGLDAPRADVDLLGYLFRDVGWLDLGGEGALQVDLRIERGHVVPESFIHARAVVDARFLDYQIHGQARVRGAVVAASLERSAGDAPSSTLEITFDAFSVRQENQAEPHAFGEGAVLRVAGHELDLAEPNLEWTVDLRVPSAVVPDLTYYNAYLPPGSSLALRSGTGSVAADLHFDVSSARVEGEVHVEGKAVEILFDDVVLRGDLAIDTSIRNGDAVTRHFDISGTKLSIENARLGTLAGDEDDRRGTPVTDEGWWGEVEMRQGEVDLTPLGLHGVLDLRMRDTGPFVHLLNKGKQRPGWLTKLLEIKEISGHGTVVYRKAAVDLGSVDLHLGDKLKFLAELSLSRDSPHLLLFCKYGVLTVALEQIGQEREWGLVRSLRWYEARREAWRGTARETGRSR